MIFVFHYLQGEFLRAGDEGGAAAAGEVGLALFDRSEDAAQQGGGAQLPCPRRALRRQVPQPGDARLQHLDDLPGDGIAAAGKQDGVEGAVGVDVGGAVAIARGGFGTRDGFPERRDLGVGCAGYELARHCRFQRGPHLVDLARLVGGERGDGEDAAAAAHDEALGFQRLQSGADRGAAGAEFSNEIALDEARAGAEAQRQDRLAQPSGAAPGPCLAWWRHGADIQRAPVAAKRMLTQ